MTSVFDNKKPLLERLSSANYKTLLTVIPGGVSNLLVPLSESKARELLALVEQSQEALNEVADYFRKIAGVPPKEEGMFSCANSNFQVKPEERVPVTIAVKISLKDMVSKIITIDAEGLSRRQLQIKEQAEVLSELEAHFLDVISPNDRFAYYRMHFDSEEARRYLNSIGVSTIASSFQFNLSVNPINLLEETFVYGTIPASVVSCLKSP